MTKELVSQFVSVMDTIGGVHRDDEMHVLMTRASRGLGSDAESYLNEEPVNTLEGAILFDIESSIEYRTDTVKDIMLSELHGGDIPAEDVMRWLDENDDKTQAIVRTALMGAARNFYRDLADSLGRPYESLKGQESHLNDMIVQHLMGRFKYKKKQVVYKIPLVFFTIFLAYKYTILRISAQSDVYSLL